MKFSTIFRISLLTLPLNPLTQSSFYRLEQSVMTDQYLVDGLSSQKNKTNDKTVSNDKTVVNKLKYDVFHVPKAWLEKKMLVELVEH